MHPERMNHDFLDAVVAGRQVDAYYHLGVLSDDPLLEELRGVTAIIMGGSGERIDGFARRWSTEHGGARVVSFPKEDRFVTRYCDGVLFVSHGMGMPSASIAVQELMKLAYFLKGGDLDALDRIFWARVGTSGGVGLPAGTIVATTEGLMADLKPYRLLDGAGGEHWFDGQFPERIADSIITANADSGLPITTGKTVATHEFFIEQFRLDGAIRFASEERKITWLQWIHEHGVRNIEMEGAMFAGYMNWWGFSQFAMLCTTLLNRLEGDQIDTTPAELAEFNERAGVAMFHYLRTITDSH